MTALIPRSLWLILLCAVLAVASTALGRSLPSEGQIVYTSGQGRTRLIALDLASRLAVTIAEWVYPVSRLFPSPDGQRIAFYGDDGYLHIVNSDGSDHITLNSIIYNSNVMWLPNNYEIIVTTFTTTPIIVNVDERTQRVIEANLEFACGIGFVSPDGQRIAVETAGEEGGAFLCDGGMTLMDVNGDNRIELLTREEVPTTSALSVLWSPDSSHAVLFSLNGVYLMTDGNPVTVEQVSLSGFIAEYTLPMWSQDSTQLAFISGRASDIIIFPLVPEVGEMRQLTNTVAVEANVTWSPDGAQIAFISGDPGAREVFILDLTTGEQRQLTENSYVVSYVMWLP